MGSISLHKNFGVPRFSQLLREVGFFRIAKKEVSFFGHKSVALGRSIPIFNQAEQIIKPRVDSKWIEPRIALGPAGQGKGPFTVRLFQGIEGLLEFSKAELDERLLIWIGAVLLAGFH